MQKPLTANTYIFPNTIIQTSVEKATTDLGTKAIRIEPRTDRIESDAAKACGGAGTESAAKKLAESTPFRGV